MGFLYFDCCLVFCRLLCHLPFWGRSQKLVEKYGCCSLTTKRCNVSLLPEEFVLTCPYSQFALSATNAVRVAPIDVSKKLIVSSLTSGDRNCHITLVKDLRMSSSTPTYPCELTWAILFSSLESGEWDRVRRAWGLGILSKCEHTQNEKAFKVRTHSKWEHTQNENAFKMRTHSKWERIPNENTLKMRTHSKWELTQNENAFQMRTHSKWECIQNENTLKMKRIQNENTLKKKMHSKWEHTQNENAYSKWEHT